VAQEKPADVRPAVPGQRRNAVKRIVSLAAGVAVGYVLGSRAGREKYEQIAAAARRYAGSPATEGLNVDAGAPAATPSRSRRTSTAPAPRERFSADPADPADGAETDGAETDGAETDREELRVTAKELIEDMPGETALGNPDPAAGGLGNPKEYEGR
jgi:hypothetical protein